MAPISEGAGNFPASSSKISGLVKQTFGSYENLVQIANQMGADVQGSGWVWLGYNKQANALILHPMANQDPVVLADVTPLLGLDVWEHAYYLQYKNARAEYLKNIWKVVNWKNVEDRFNKAV